MAIALCDCLASCVCGVYAETCDDAACPATEVFAHGRSVRSGCFPVIKVQAFGMFLDEFGCGILCCLYNVVARHTVEEGILYRLVYVVGGRALCVGPFGLRRAKGVAVFFCRLYGEGFGLRLRIWR